MYICIDIALATKAEFDSLKNNFQAQIDNYNSSIDNKIDGAIASYLAGVKIATTFDLQLPTAQHVYKTLDAINFPQTWDNVRVNCFYTELKYQKWRDVGCYPYMIKFTYDQNDGTNTGVNMVARAIPSVSDVAYAIIEGYSNDFRDDIQLLYWNCGMQNQGSSDNYWERWQCQELFHGDNVSRNYGIDKTTHKEIYLDHYDKVEANLHFLGYADGQAFTASSKIKIGSPRDTDILGEATHTNTHNRSSETVKYTIESDQLVMVLGSNHMCPVQYNNCWELGEDSTNYAKYDVDYLRWDAKGQRIDGWMAQGKKQNNTSGVGANDFKAPWLRDDMITNYPGTFTKIAMRTSSYYYVTTTSGGVYSYGCYYDDAHAYLSSSDDYKTYDDKALTNEYANIGLVDKIKQKWGSDAILQYGGNNYYKLGKGLVLCSVENAGTLKIGVTAKTDDVYFYVYDKPTSRTEPAIVAMADSDPSKGNGVPLVKNNHKVISYNVDPGIYFFRFGTYTGDWHDLAGETVRKVAVNVNK